MVCHIGRAGDVRLMTGDKVAILRRHEVGLDVVRAHPDRERVALKRVVGKVARSTAVTDHERMLLALYRLLAERRRCEEGRQHESHQGH
jgi:hypothetical protein